MSEALSLIKQEIGNKFLTVMGTEKYPAALREGIQGVLQVVNENRTLTDLYPEVLQEIPMSQSLFMDMCVQFEEHFTPHRRLRQVMLELGGKLDALDAAKNGHKKAIVKVARLKEELKNLEGAFENLQQCSVSIDTYYLVQQFFPNFFPDSIVRRLYEGEITNVSLVESLRKKVETKAGEKFVELEEAERGLRSHEHMVKDAAIKAHQLQQLAEKYQQEVAASGMSFEESEFVYYVMYFTAEAERQLRTGDHQIDRGTFMAISQTPDPIRKKILWNIDFLRNKLQDNYPVDGEFLFKQHRDILVPRRTGDMEFEGLSVRDYFLIEPARLLAGGTRDGESGL